MRIMLRLTSLILTIKNKSYILYMTCVINYKATPLSCLLVIIMFTCNIIVVFLFGMRIIFVKLLNLSRVFI